MNGLGLTQTLARKKWSGHFAVSNAGLSPFYHSKQIGELKKKLGITLDDTTGLLNEWQFLKASKLSGVYKYRRRGLIKPVGWAVAPGHGLSAHYRPGQIKELKKKLGITLDDTAGLLIEDQFRKASGLSQISKYRKEGLLKPVGWAMAGSSVSVSPFYHPRQINELRKRLGVTLTDATGLLNEQQFKNASGLTAIPRYRKQGFIKPVGWAMGGAGLSAHYRPRQIKKLKKMLGITLEDTAGLLNESQFTKVSGLSQITKYREQGLIKPVGWALTTGGRLSPHYRHCQISELKKKLGITLKDTSRLLNETQFADRCGLSSCTTVSKYRKQGLVKPVGWAIAGPSLSAHYHPRQIKELKKKLGITLDDITGLLNEEQFRKSSGLSGISKYRKLGLIEPVGWAIAGPGLSAHYHSRQIKELKAKLKALKRKA